MLRLLADSPKSAEWPTLQMSALSAAERLAVLSNAAGILENPRELVTIAVEAVSAACPRGLALGFIRRKDGRVNEAHAVLDGEAVSLRTIQAAPLPKWVVDLDNVPASQRNNWIKPMEIGVHGPEFFEQPMTATILLGSGDLDYGRVMICDQSRLVGWVGVYVQGAMRDRETEDLRILSSHLISPLRIGACFGEAQRRHLSVRQQQIVSGVARGLSNKAIARELDLSPTTVKTLLERLYRATGVPNRAALAAWWRDGVSP